MSGDAVEAYALLLQAINTCALLDGTVSGRTDIGYLAKKLRDVYGDIRKYVVDLPRGIEAPSVPNLDVVLVGWSWRRLRFEGYSYSFNDDGTVNFKSLSELHDQTAYGVYFLGDAAPAARTKLKQHLEDNNYPKPMRGHDDAHETAANAFLDWEPLDIIQQFIASDEHRSVGGVPQVTKIYQYGEAEGFVWRSDAGIHYFGGRPLQANERFDRRVLAMASGQVEVSFSPASIVGASVPEDVDDRLAIEPSLEEETP